MKRINQNNQPDVITEVIDAQSNGYTDFVTVNLGMAPQDQFNIWGFFCYIEDGDINLGDIDNDAADEFTYTDIAEEYRPSRGAGDVALPLCCRPRNGMGEALYLEVWLGKKQAFHQNNIPLAAFNNNQNDNGPCPNVSCTKLLPFREALAVYPTEEFRLRVLNTNPVTADVDTYSRAHLTFIGEVVDKEMALEILKQRFAPESEPTQ